MVTLAQVLAVPALVARVLVARAPVARVLAVPALVARALVARAPVARAAWA